jgi:hypothetical protein
MFLHFLNICGYDLIQDNEGEIADDRESIDELRKNKIEDKIIYNKIKNIDIIELETIKKKINRKQATQKEKMQVQKWYFDLYIDGDISQEFKQKYFEFYLDTNNKRFLTNLYQEANNSVEYNFLRQFETRLIGENIKLQSLKLYYVREIVGRLGLTSSLDNKIISRQQVEGLNEFIFENKDNIYKVFNFRDQSKRNTPNFIQTEAVISKIFKSWCNAKNISINDRKQQKQNLCFESVFSACPPYKFEINNNNQHILPIAEAVIIPQVPYAEVFYEPLDICNPTDFISVVSHKFNKKDFVKIKNVDVINSVVVNKRIVRMHEAGFGVIIKRIK